jgi:L-lactate dehydrogenase complex protein LldE
MALYTLDVFERAQGPVVVPSGSCAAMVKHGYVELFQDDAHNLRRARELAARTFEFSQFLVDVLGVTDVGSPGPAQVVYHPACHTLRGMGIDRQPQALLEAAGIKVHALEAECCGFGGVFAIDQAELSSEMLARKIQAIEATDASTVVANDVSCLMHIEGGLRRRGSTKRCAHLAQVLTGKEHGLR